MTRTRTPALLAWLFVVLLALPASLVTAQTPQASPAAETVHGINPADMDRSVAPGDDFNQYANGGWLERTQLPADQPAYGVFNEIGDQVDVDLVSIINDLSPDTTTPGGKVRTLYDQVLDTETRNEQGVTPLEPIHSEIASIASIEDGLVFQQQADNYQLGGLFVVWASPSPDDATVNVGNLYGPILSLPSEDYYGEGEDFTAVRDAWLTTTAALLVELGYTEDEAATAAQAVLDFESELVKIKTPDGELFSDPVAQNNPRTLDELAEMLPSMDWNAFVVETHVPDDTDTFVVIDLPYLEKLQGVLDTADPMVLKYIFDTQLMWTYADYLSTDIEEIAFSFTGPVLLGVSDQLPADERALGDVAIWMPDTISSLYVDQHFSPEAKAEVEGMVDNLIAAFRIRIEQSAWMSPETQAKALEKLDLLVAEVGYPSTFKDYDNVVIGDSLFSTVLNAYDAGNSISLGDIGQPVDRGEWFQTPFEVNAGYDATRNMIIFPAAILQAPFFDPAASPAANYGAIGSVIGHEITHGFDLGGSQYDGYGNVVSWWTDEDFAAFSALNEEAVAQFSALEALPGLPVDGQLTVQENVADMGGLQIAYDALMIELGDQATPTAAVAGESFTPAEEFFLAWARNWRQVSTPEYIQYLVAVDSHAPAAIRAVQPLRNMDQFFETFDITAGQPVFLDPADRIVIW
jgi:predicted metalloendopeptidase